MSNYTGADDDAREHLEGIQSGAGCTEIWERLTERRANAETADDSDLTH